MVQISPSILSADFLNLASEIKKIQEAGASMLHIDVMDGHFVPNLSFGPSIISSMRGAANLIFDVHLMITEPENWVEIYVKSGADIITFHPEASQDAKELIKKIRMFDKKVGIAISPNTRLSSVIDLIPLVDYVLVMFVMPGFSGQAFMHSRLQILAEINDIRKTEKLDFLISVDGGINPTTAALCLKAGADILVSGSYIFRGDYKDRIQSLIS